MSKPEDTDEEEFRRGANERSPSLVVEFWLFLRQEKKWWLVPILLTLLLLGVLVALGSSPVTAPFIYTLW